jgi:hypothetical protein
VITADDETSGYGLNPRYNVGLCGTTYLAIIDRSYDQNGALSPEAEGVCG